MVSALTGELVRIDGDRLHLRAGPLVFELLLPAADAAELHSRLGREVTLHTLCYLEGDPNRGNLEPRLLGFVRLADKRFFEHFTTVKGIGPRTALKALTIPVPQIARAIENKDTRFLKQLKGIGQRTAELIVAELAGKVRDFAAAPEPGMPAAAPRPAHEEDALGALVALGETRAMAERLLESVKRDQPALATTAELVREMLVRRGG